MSKEKVLKQFQYFYEITDKNIEDIMKQKISRQLERIENEIKNIRDKALEIMLEVINI